MPYDTVGTDNGNNYKVQKALTAYDSDAKAAVDFLIASKNCNGRIGSTGMCLGGHLVRLHTLCAGLALLTVSNPS